MFIFDILDHPPGLVTTSVEQETTAQRRRWCSRGAPPKTGDSRLMDVKAADMTEDLPGGVRLQLIDN